MIKDLKGGRTHTTSKKDSRALILGVTSSLDICLRTDSQRTKLRLSEKSSFSY